MGGGGRDAVRDRHRLLGAGRADYQDARQDALPADGAGAPGNSPAQQLGRTGSVRLIVYALA